MAEPPPLPPGGSFDARGEPARELSDSDLALALRWRGTSGPEAAAEARAAILAAWADVKSSAHVYCCVQSLSFLKPRVTAHPRAAAALAALAATSPGGHCLEVGVAFGQDTRAAVLAGVRPSQLTVADVTSAYWRAGLRVFGDDAGGGSQPAAHSLAGVTTSWADWAAPGDGGPDDPGAPLASACALVLCFYVLHVLSAPQVEHMLARLFRCTAPGGLLLGACVGSEGRGSRPGVEAGGVEAAKSVDTAAGPVPWGATPDGTGARRVLHSAGSLRAALLGAGFDGAEVEPEEGADEAEEAAARAAWSRAGAPAAGGGAGDRPGGMTRWRFTAWRA